MINYKTEEEIDLIRESSLLVAKTHAYIASCIKPGVTGLFLDKIAEEYIRDNGGIPAFNKEKKDLIDVTTQSLYLGIEKAVDGNRLGDIGHAIQNYVEKLGYGVVRELVGHGVGKNLHESPEVPNYGSRGKGVLLKEGMVIAIEPMINVGCKNITQHDDGWTITTLDNKPSAHFEHTVVVRKNKAEILSSFVEIEKITNGKAS